VRDTYLDLLHIRAQ